MPASWHLCPTLDAQEALSQFARRQGQVFGKGGNPCRDFNVLPLFELWRRVAVLIVETSRGTDRLGHPVNHDIVEQFVFAKTLLDVAIAIAPSTELLYDPGGQTDGRVVQPIGQGLRLCRLNHDIPALLHEPSLDGTEKLLLGRGGVRQVRGKGDFSWKANVGQVDTDERARMGHCQQARNPATNIRASRGKM